MKLFKILLAAILLMVPASLAAHAVDMTAWRKTLIKQISQYQKYPPAALNRNIEGAGQARVVFNADGSIAEFSIEQSTGQKILDREIPKVLKKLRMPAIPNGEQYVINIPFSWRLQ